MDIKQVFKDIEEQEIIEKKFADLKSYSKGNILTKKNNSRLFILSE